MITEINLAIDEGELRGTSLAVWSVNHPSIPSERRLRWQPNLLQHVVPLIVFWRSKGPEMTKENGENRKSGFVKVRV